MNGVKFGETSARDGGGNPELSPGAFLAPIGRSQCVAVGTEQAQIGKAIVSVVSVDMVKLEGDRPVLPGLPPAQRTLVKENLLPKEPVSELERLYRNLVAKVWSKRTARRKVLSAIPGLAGEMRDIQTEVPDCLA